MTDGPGTAWLGGGTGSGKTTVARLLATRLGLRVYPIDAFWYAHAERLGERWPTPDEQWLDRSPAAQAKEFEETSRRRLQLVLDDLERLPSSPAVVVEGPQVLADALPQGSAAVILEAAEAFRRTVLTTRPMPPTSDPPRALANRIEKDALYAGRVRRLALEHGVPLVPVDRARTPEEVADEVEALLFPARPALPSRDALAAARRWENEAVAANIRSWLGSDSAPRDPLGPLPFACECGRAGCAATVHVELAAFEQTDRRVVVHRSRG